MLGVFSKCEPLQLDHREALQSLCLSGEHSSPFKFTSVLSPQVREGNQNATICPWLLLQGPERVPRLTSWPESLVPSEGTPCPFGTHRRCLRDSPFLFVWRIFRAGLFCVCVCMCVCVCVWTYPFILHEVYQCILLRKLWQSVLTYLCSWE